MGVFLEDITDENNKVIERKMTTQGWVIIIALVALVITVIIIGFSYNWWQDSDIKSSFTSYFSPGKEDNLKLAAKKANNLAQMEIINNKLKAVSNQKK